MLELKKTPEHTIDRVFLLALLALFAATAFLVVSIGAKQYHSIADSMTAYRILLSGRKNESK